VRDRQRSAPQAVFEARRVALDFGFEALPLRVVADRDVVHGFTPNRPRKCASDPGIATRVKATP
jgi:hypothetical protein